MYTLINVDVWQVINAAKTKPFWFISLLPRARASVRLHTRLPIIPLWKLNSLNYNPRFVRVAEDINFGMPSYVTDLGSDALNGVEKNLKGSNVLLRGVAFN